MKRCLFVLCVYGASAVAQVQGGDSLQAVDAERAKLQAESSQAEALCYERFAVNACLSAVAAQRRAQSAVLRKRELALRELQRAERTREQLERLEDKQADKLQQTLEAQGKQAASPAEPKVAPVPVPVKAGASAADKSTPLTPEQAAANRAAFEARQEEAARYKAEVEKRLLENKDRAEPLPPRP